MGNSTDITTLLGRKISMHTIRYVVSMSLSDTAIIKTLYQLSKSEDERLGVNALWCLTHIQKQLSDTLQSEQNGLIDMLLKETYPGKKRLLLELLRRQSYTPESVRTDFLEYCFSKINSECEPYAVRSFSIYCAFNMCRFYPELTAELEAYLDMLALQNPSPGLRSALRTTRLKIKKIKTN